MLRQGFGPLATQRLVVPSLEIANVARTLPDSARTQKPQPAPSVCAGRWQSNAEIAMRPAAYTKRSAWLTTVGASAIVGILVQDS